MVTDRQNHKQIEQSIDFSRALLFYRLSVVIIWYSNLSENPGIVYRLRLTSIKMCLRSKTLTKNNVSFTQCFKMSQSHKKKLSVQESVLTMVESQLGCV